MGKSDPMEEIDFEYAFRTARHRLQMLWNHLVHVVQLADRIVRHQAANQPLADFSVEMLPQHAELLLLRTECVQSFCIGLSKGPNARWHDLSPMSLFEHANEIPPVMVRDGAFTFLAVMAVAKAVLELGWYGVPGIEREIIHTIDTPSYDCPPAYRLCDRSRWEYLGVPFLPDRELRQAIENALEREDSKADSELSRRLAARDEAAANSRKRAKIPKQKTSKSMNIANLKAAILALHERGANHGSTASKALSNPEVLVLLKILQLEGFKVVINAKYVKSCLVGESTKANRKAKPKGQKPK